MTDPKEAHANGSARGLYWLLWLPFVAVAVPYFYNFWEPSIAGIPFFYWYQVVWVFLTAGLTYYISRREEA